MPPRGFSRLRSLFASGDLRAPFLLALVVAALVHLPMTPVMLVFSFISTLIDIKDAEKVDYDAGVTTISVDLDPSQAQQPPRPPQENVNAQQVEAPADPESAIKLPKGEERTAEARTEPQARDSRSEPEAKKEPEKKPPEKKTPEALGLTGDINRAVQGKTNVTLTVWFSSIRDYPNDESIRPLLSCGLLGATFQRAGIEPVRDIDGAMFAGQQLNDPRGFTVAVQHTLDGQQVHDAMDRLVKPKGEWIDEHAAKFYAVRAQRVAFPHGARMLFVTPEKGWQQVRAIRNPLGIPEPRGRVLSLNLLRPSIPFRKLGLRLPESLAELRLDVYLSVTGDAEISMRFEDKDAASASRHADEVSRRVKDFFWQVKRVADVSSLLTTSPAAGPVELPDPVFVADDKAIVAQLKLSAEQTSSLSSRLTGALCAKPKAPATPTSSTPIEPHAPPVASAPPAAPPIAPPAPSAAASR